MPIYEFACSKCKAGFELLLPRRAAADSARCTTCGSKRVRRRMSACVGRSGSAGGAKAVAGGGSSCAGCRRSSCAGCR
ncbi:MAG: zinc ribbon domain-containing protein [Armatimonadetes bacterium]|nr:zinc ribbon domain-containing protein [Armatimonadota bacterium]